MDVNAYIEKIKKFPETLKFDETIKVIEENYSFTPTAFQNGALYNKAGENSGSCKLFSFAQLHQLSQEHTLACFGAYYFEDVLMHPDATNHQNIRNFMKTGWEGIKFEGSALTQK
jgi:hypothetical protein